MLHAREAWQAGKCRRETPIAWVEPDGTLVEGVIDLVFEEDDDEWTIVDFKTDAEIEIALEHYRRQVNLYASAVARATGGDAKAILIRL